MQTLGGWFQTYSGRQFYLLNPRPDDVVIGDIAHALANVCRFGGHTREFYSIAQHSVHCCQWLAQHEVSSPLTRLHGLLHDASEAYLGDVVRPLKETMDEYRVREERMMETIYEALKLPPLTEDEYRVVKQADNSLLMAERRDLIQHCDIPWNIDAEPWRDRVIPWTPMVAEQAFHRFYLSLREQVASTSTNV